jgi:hypothetical protein
MFGFLIYDGPPLILHDRFVNFRVSPGSVTCAPQFPAANPNNCGSLTFADDPAGIDFYGENFIVENGGSLIAGSARTPIGNNCSAGKCGQVTIHLWGQAADRGALCKFSTHCGLPDPLYQLKCQSRSLRLPMDRGRDFPPPAARRYTVRSLSLWIPPATCGSRIRTGTI